MPQDHKIHLQQIYPLRDEPLPKSGALVLTDRLWPRGFKKTELEDLKIEWYKAASPSDELRKRFHGKKLNDKEFNEAYRKELSDNPKALEPLVQYAQKGPLYLITALHEPQDSYLSVLSEQIKKQLK